MIGHAFRGDCVPRSAVLIFLERELQYDTALDRLTFLVDFIF